MTVIDAKIKDMHDADLLHKAVKGDKAAQAECDRRHPGQYDWSALGNPGKPHTGPKFQVKPSR